MRLNVLVLAAIVLILSAPAVSQQIQIAQCKEGVCVIAEETLDRILEALGYWYDMAKKKCA